MHNRCGRAANAFCGLCASTVVCRNTALFLFKWLVVVQWEVGENVGTCVLLVHRVNNT